MIRLKIHKRLRLKHVAIVALVVFLMWIKKGGHLKLFEKSFETEFSYPIEGDLRKLIHQMRMGELPDQQPINHHFYKFNKLGLPRCRNLKDGIQLHNLNLVFVVKSYVEHFTLRQVIRRTWGQEKRFNNVNIRTVFLLGTDYKYVMYGDDAIQQKVDEESREYKDIVQADFIDSYYNNTLKMMMGLKWCAVSCPEAEFYAFIDDDYYVSTKNLLAFLRNPSNYPSYLKNLSDKSEECDCRSQAKHNDPNGLNDLKNPFNGKLYAGNVFHAPPQRDLTNKWYLSLTDYPFDMFPAYVTGGSYVLSKSALQDFYFGSYFVQQFPFDDVFLGLLAKKVSIEPFHSPEFRFYPDNSNKEDSFRFAVASHGFSDYDMLESFWNKQRDLGFA